jgi:foldase protein PrsA
MASVSKKPTKKSSMKVEKKKSSSFLSLTSRLPKFSRPTSFPKFNPVKTALVLGVILLVALLYFFQDVYLFAKVNGKPISAVAVMRELEQVKQNEVAEVVNIMIDKTLILQEAKKRNIVIPEEEIDQEIKKTEDQLKQSGQTLDSQLALLGITREGLRENYRIQKSIEKMLGEATVTDAEINKYMEDNKDALPQDQDEKELRNMVKEQLSQQKLGEKYQKFIADLRSKSDITTFRSYLNTPPAQ